MNGAIPALRGYRKQFLYTLNRILSDTDGKYIFYPEGKEDLDILDIQSSLVSIHQVKAYSKVLTYSNIESFIVRAVKILLKNADLTAELVSFGDFGGELEGVKSGNKKAITKITNKLQKSGFSKQQIKLVFNKIEWIKVDENEQYKEIDQFLSKNPLVAGDSKTAFQLLIYWVYQSAENRQLITHTDLIKKLHEIGSWITDRELHHQEWNVTIKPLEAFIFDSKDKQRLQNEIDEGISVNYQHIISSVDIERPIWLEQIQTSFHDKNVVILHGASGQGKTALAYRYIHNYLPKDWAFQIHALDDRKRALEIATALTGYTKSLQIPIFLYIDVSPKDEGWSELVLQLARLKNIKILVTIREEDWRKASFDQTSVSFDELLLEFNEKEAKEIYFAYKPPKNQSGVKFLDFEDIWNQFGGKGPLLEFTYLLKKHETLHARLKSQINHIQQEVNFGKRSVAELTLLKLVAVAGAYEAKLDLKKVVDLLELLTPVRTIELLEEEYLLRQSSDSSLLTGLHSIRCKVMSEILLDDVLDPWEVTAKLCLPLVDSVDIQQFLLNAFVEHINARQVIIDQLTSITWHNWTSFGGASKALIWLGVRLYVDENKALFDEVYSIYGDAYWMLLKFDLVGILEKDTSEEILDLILDDEEKRKQIESLKSRQVPIENAFKVFSDWICQVQPPKTHCKTNSDFKSAGQLAYWAAHTGNHKKLYKPLNLDYYTVSTLQYIDINCLGDFVFGLSHLHLINKKGYFKSWYFSIEEFLYKSYQHETGTVFIEQKDDWIKTHFIVPAEGEQQETEEENFIHNKTVSVLNLLSKIAPSYKNYRSQGYGHNLILVDYDPTVKDIEFSIMAPDWVVEVNMVFRILTGHSYRPSTWQEYTDNIIEARKAVLTDLKNINKKLSTYFRKHKPISVGDGLFDSTNAYFNRLNKFPLEALDSWGYSEERSKSDNNRQSSLAIKFSAGLLRFEECIEVAGNYSTGISNFTNQAPDLLAVFAHLGNAKTEKKKKELKAVATNLNINLAQSHLAGLNLFNSWESLEKNQENFILHFSEVSSLSKIDLLKLENEERMVFESAWCLWFAFINHPERQWNTAEKTARLLFSNAKKNIFKKLRNTFSNKLSRGVRISIIDATLSYDGKPALWLTAESDDVLDAYLCLEEVHQKLKKMTKDTKLHSLEYYVWEKYWKNILVIPLMRGKLLQAQAWCLPNYSFMSVFGADELGWENQVIRPLPVKTVTDLNLSVWDKPLLKKCTKFVGVVTMIHHYLLHLLELDKIPESEGSGIEIIQGYLNEVQEKISLLSQQFIDISTLIMELPCKLADGELLERDDLLEVAQAVSENYKSMLPQDDCDGNFKLSFKDIEEWSQRVSEVFEKMQLIGLIWAVDIIENT